MSLAIISNNPIVSMQLGSVKFEKEIRTFDRVAESSSEELPLSLHLPIRELEISCSNYD